MSRRIGDKRKGKAVVQQRSKRRVADGLFEISASMNNFVSTCQNYTQGGSPSCGASGGVTSLNQYERMFSLLLQLPGMEAGSRFYIDCTKVLRDPELLAMFLAQHSVDKEAVFKWLKAMVADKFPPNENNFPHDDDMFPPA